MDLKNETISEHHETSSLVMRTINEIRDFYNFCQSFTGSKFLNDELRSRINFIRTDPRAKQWLLMGSPLPILTILAVYLTMVKYGPVYMHSRKSIQLKWPLVFYNFGVTLLNGWMAIEVRYNCYAAVHMRNTIHLLHCALQRNYNFICQLVDTSDNEFEVRIANAIWWYFFSKLIEFMDTFFFIVRKKTRQLTFLHVYHHSTMFAFWWVGAKFVPGGSALPGAMVNCFVHVFMYSYYCFSAFGPHIQRYLWWKKYLTILQLVQFTTGVVLGLHAIITNCQFTRWMQYVFVCYAFSFIVLFGNFYRDTYKDCKQQKSK
ncbi:elongation of very long chain fatty acids protein 4-like protein [Leptotrombidium deliense]|uniref:Elongation of very long chain fatty acids protein n=1 Tax=Leptotrombidium deliense TaxID=299467 RepID=A0A443SA75_9ACAR|nr:elongation of very long chain fatty acids protein 4-like protein [Leptotrombidium deliense]